MCALGTARLYVYSMIMLFMVYTCMGRNETLFIPGKAGRRGYDCTRNDCVLVYCKDKAPNYRWSCQSRKETAEFQVCTYFTKTESEYNKLSAVQQDKVTHSLNLPWCGKTMPNKEGYKYVGFYPDELCPTSWPIRNETQKYPIWSECKGML